MPTIVSWPGKIKSRVTDQTSISIDWFPTFANMAGILLDEMPMDGLDLSPLLFDRNPLPERNFYWRIRGNWAVRSGPWKLTYANGESGLFNLDTDIGETIDLSNKYPEKVKLLQSAYNRWNADVNSSAKIYD